jgi:hypothetical protein
MKVHIAIEAALVAVLAVYGVRLARNARMLDLQANEGRYLAVAGERIAFQSVTGLDATGRFVNKVIPPGTKRFVVFALRGSTFQDDLNFWNGVAALLPKDRGIRLLGFCDGTACAETLRSANQQGSFPIIVYGEATSSQAIINADTQGNLILLSGALATVGKVSWRGADDTPASVARLVLP